MEKRVLSILAILLLLFGSVGLVSADDLESLFVRGDQYTESAVMVASYVLTPETLMPGDVGLLTITLENVYGSMFSVKVKSSQGAEIDGSYTLAARIKEASISGYNFKVYDKYMSSSTIGPGKQVEFPFKIKAPYEDDLYMLKFYASTKNMLGATGNSVRHYIPVLVSSNSPEILLLDVSEESIKLEVTNDGLSKVDGVAVVASDIIGMELQRETVYIGEMNPGESAIVVFNISSVAAEKQDNSADFRVLFNNWINEHEAEPVCVKIPYHNIENEAKNEGQPLTATQNYTNTAEEKRKDVAETKIPGFGLITSIFMLVVVAYLKRTQAKI
uniref:CARDB domain-containing protein n=1 Tax=Candidatus Methanophaga sp. ANME-1 ERB7 TaxID=2759913 RepID=A0A7G9ZCI9_9EURY|nr:hypothetical protein NNIPPFBB_00018 [Methanosarcinales archaeon ANME-1 ERB7]